MITETNLLDVPEIASYSVQDIEGGRIVRYLQRSPGETDWQPVKLFTPDTFTCTQCGEAWPRDRMSNPDGTGPICVPCLWPAGD